MTKLKRPVPLPRKKVSVTADTSHSHVTSPGNRDNSDHVTSPGNRDNSDHVTSPGNRDNSDHVTSPGNRDNSDHVTYPGNHDNSDHVTYPGNHDNSDHVTGPDSIGFHSYVNLTVLDDEGGSDEDDALLQEDSDKEEMHQYLKPAPPKEIPEYLEILPPDSLLPCQPEEPSYLKVLPQNVTPPNDVTDVALPANLETYLSPIPAVVSPHDLEDLPLSGHSSYSPLWRDQDSPDFESLPFDLNMKLETGEWGQWGKLSMCTCSVNVRGL